MWGRRVYAVGSNKEAARSSGIPVKAVLWSVYILAGLLVGLASATLVTRAGRPWMNRVVALVSRVSDQLLRPVWGRARRVASSLRVFP